MDETSDGLLRASLPVQPNRSLMDGLLLLQSVMSASGPVSGVELARRFGMEATRAHRMLRTLAHMGFVRLDERRRFLPGIAVNVLAAQGLASAGLMQRALPVLRELGRSHGDCVVALGVLWEMSVSYLYHAEPGMSFEEGIGRLGYYPASQSVIGQMLVSLLSEDELRIRREHASRADGEGSEWIPGRAQRLKIRRQGYCCTTAADGRTYSVAVPIGEDGWLGLALSRLDKSIDRRRVINLLKRRAGAIVGGSK